MKEMRMCRDRHMWETSLDISLKIFQTLRAASLSLWFSKMFFSLALDQISILSCAI
jgi:hypothetical protein